VRAAFELGCGGFAVLAFGWRFVATAGGEKGKNKKNDGKTLHGATFHGVDSVATAVRRSTSTSRV
jgi:hypothetical protein